MPAASDATSTASFDAVDQRCLAREREVGDEDRHREADAAEQAGADDVTPVARRRAASTRRQPTASRHSTNDAERLAEHQPGRDA